MEAHLLLGNKTIKGKIFSARSSVEKNSTCNSQKHLVLPSQAKTENMTYPWPNVSLVTLGEKQENNNCQQLLPLYMHTGRSTATVEQL